MNVRFERIQNKEKTLRMRVIQERGITDQQKLMSALQEIPDYQQTLKEAKEVNEMRENSKYVLDSMQEYEDFLGVVSQAVTFLSQLLSSKTIMDTIEAIKVFRLLHQYGIADAAIGIKKMLALVFSKDTQV